MKEQTMYIAHISPIKAFIENNKRLFDGIYGKSALYLQDNCEGIYVIQATNGTCFIFRLDCGVLQDIKTERNAMEKYMMRIPTSEYAEYIVF